MTERADVVIVGGGAMGASTAFHLAELGITDVVLVEREVLAAGSTSKAAGGVRLQFADEVNIRLMLRSLPEFERFDERFGTDIRFHQAGYLFLLSEPADVAAFRGAVALQQRLGVPSRELTVEEAVELVPQIDPSGLLAATYCPRDGHATPEAVVQGYAAAAHARGVRVRQHCEVTGIDLAGGRIAAVHTTKGTIRTDTVVCTAGVGSAAIGRLVGLDLPVLADLEVQTSWWGDYEMSPDRNAIVGEAAEPSRFLYATGFSGHGFQQCPAIGEHLAELIAGRAPTLDLSTLTVERFSTGAVRSEAFVV